MWANYSKRKIFLHPCRWGRKNFRLYLFWSEGSRWRSIRSRGDYETGRKRFSPHHLISSPPHLLLIFPLSSIFLSPVSPSPHPLITRSPHCLVSLSLSLISSSSWPLVTQFPLLLYALCALPYASFLEWVPIHRGEENSSNTNSISQVKKKRRDATFFDHRVICWT